MVGILSTNFLFGADFKYLFQERNMYDAIAFAGPLIIALLFSFWILKTYLIGANTNKLPPGTTGRPFIGETIPFVTNPLEFYRSRAQKYGTPFLTHVIFAPTVVMGGADEEMRWLWNTERKEQSKHSWPSHWTKLMGYGAITNSTGKRHRYLRKMFEPSFSPNSIRSYVKVIDKCSQESFEKWADGKYHPSSDIKVFVLRLLFECAFGAIDEDVLEVLSSDFCIWLNAHSTFFPFALPGTLLARGLAARGRLLSFFNKMIADFKRNNSSDSDLAKNCVLGRLCYQEDDDGNRLSDEDLSTNLFIIFFAGHDTTYASVGSILNNLFCDESKEGQRVLNALVEEVASFKSINSDTLDYDELKDASILNAFLAESWRRDPPVGAGFKVALQDLSYKKFTFPKGTRLHYSIHLGAYNEQRYHHPSEFHIERFLPKGHPFVKEDKWQVNDGGLQDTLKPSYPIFGGGAHGCLGSHFAKLEARIFLTRMIQNYDIEVRHSKKVNFPLNFWANEFRLTPKEKK